MRISDWSSDVCSSDLAVTKSGTNEFHGEAFIDYTDQSLRDARPNELTTSKVKTKDFQFGGALGGPIIKDMLHFFVTYEGKRSEEHTSELQSLMRISYAVFCLQKTTKTLPYNIQPNHILII